MSDISNKMDTNCAGQCEAQYQACVSGKEHESVCRVKRAQCSCGCRLD